MEIGDLCSLREDAFLSPVLVAGNNREMIHKLARAPGTTH
jgi:hypothetical protein